MTLVLDCILILYSLSQTSTCVCYRISTTSFSSHFSHFLLLPHFPSFFCCFSHFPLFLTHLFSPPVSFLFIFLHFPSLPVLCHFLHSLLSFPFVIPNFLIWFAFLHFPPLSVPVLSLSSFSISISPASPSHFSLLLILASSIFSLTFFFIFFLFPFAPSRSRPWVL